MPLKIDSIQVINVSKHYGEHDIQALKNVSLQIHQGEFIALMGPSGCGKSTLLNLLGAMDTPSSGKVMIDGHDITQMRDNELTQIRRKRIGFIFQFFNLLSTLTVRENIALPLRLGDKRKESEIQQRIDILLKEVGLTHRGEFFPAQLSGGEMQRVAIARALIHEPSIILADEPTGNLDSENGQHILEILQRLSQERGQTILMATHSEEAAAMTQRVIRMRDGRVLEDG